MAAAATVIAAGFTVLAGAPAATAAPTCYRTVDLRTDFRDTYALTTVPSAGSTASSTSCLMGAGANSSAVRTLQRNLNRCYGESLTVDGQFGPLTQAALKRAQRSSGTAADGVYGPNTRNALIWYSVRGSSSYCFRLTHPLRLY